MFKKLIPTLPTALIAVVLGLAFATHEGVAKPPKPPNEDLNENALLSLITPKTIFVTSDTYTGDLVVEAGGLGVFVGDGLAAADAIC